MSRWPAKYVIGLTGNIATGKSVVRKMLEHLGAYGIDADVLAHRAVTKGAPGYDVVVKTFGEWILTSEGNIDRARLARIVFSDSEALERLESIVHPLVLHAIDLLIRRANQNVIVIEAIKLLETDLASSCDSIWVVVAPEELQIARLRDKRGMSEAAARQRISAQSSQKVKVRSANVVINNDGTFDKAWEQVQAAWAKLPKPKEPRLPARAAPTDGEFMVRRGMPQDAGLIAHFITQVTQGKRRLNRDDIMAAFGEKAYIFLERNGAQAALAGWQVENLVTRIDELYVVPNLPVERAIPPLIKAVEAASAELQSEASLLFLPPYLAQHTGTWRKAGYEPQTIQGLGIRAWQEAAAESMPPGSSLWFKRLRKERVLRPL